MQAGITLLPPSSVVREILRHTACGLSLYYFGYLIVSHRILYAARQFQCQWLSCGSTTPSRSRASSYQEKTTASYSSMNICHLHCTPNKKSGCGKSGRKNLRSIDTQTVWVTYFQQCMHTLAFAFLFTRIRASHLYALRRFKR